MNWKMLCRACKTNYGTKVRIVGLRLDVEVVVSVKRVVTGLLNVRNVFCWSDSQISLRWIRQVWKD